MASTNQKEFTSDGMFGGMDTRTESGGGTPGAWRILLNVDGRERRTLCRMGGWVPYGYDYECTQNRDLHDQMVGGQVYSYPVTINVPPYQELIGYDYAGIYYLEKPETYYGVPAGKYCGNWIYAEFPSSFTDGPYISGTASGYPDVYRQNPAGFATRKIVWRQQMEVTDFANSVDFGHTTLFFTVDWTSPTWVEGQTVSEIWIGQIPLAVGAKQAIEICLPEDISVSSLVFHTDEAGGWASGLPVGAPAKSSPRTECGDPPVVECTTGDPYFYELPTYSLGYGYIYPGYKEGPYVGKAVPIYHSVDGYTYVIPGDDVYYLGNTCKEAITLLHPVTSSDGKRRLIAATRSRIYVGSDSSGNWTILADGLGGPCTREDDCTCSDTRFMAASMGNSTLMVNGNDPVINWNFGAEVSGTYGWSADYISELMLLGVGTAVVVVSFQGFVFLANVKIDNIWERGRIMWSDYNDPMSWTPGGESLAGFQDFGKGEKILNALPIGGRLRVYTDQAIYDAQLVADERTFQFTEIYRGKLVPIARYAIVSTGDAHFFIGAEGIYRLAEYDREPVQLEWIRLATGVIFNGLKSEWTKDSPMQPFESWNLTRCNILTGGWSQKYRALWFSWPTGNSDCPNMTLVLWTDNQKSTLVDHGFTAFCEWMPDTSPSWRDMLSETGLCDPDQDLGLKEGTPCPSDYRPGPPDVSPPQDWPYLWNEEEDGTKPMGPDAYFSQFCNVCLDDFCHTCESDGRFIMASVVDKALKQWTPNQFARWMVQSESEVVFPETTEATYVEEGYTTMLQTLETRSDTETVKTMRTVSLNYQSVYQLTPGQMFGQAGGGETAYCLDWENVPPQIMDCPNTPGQRSPSQLRFPFYTVGVHHALRFWVEGTGSQFCLAGMSVLMTANQHCWKATQ